MGENSKIEWTDHTFNPWMGCTKVSPACDGCYAEALMDLRYGKVQWGPHGERVRTAPANWKQPVKWDKAAAAAGTRPRVFCASLADVFDNQVPPEWRADLFALIRATPNLIWLLLTKRPQNIVKMVAAIDGGLPPNAALGTSVEDQVRFDLNVPALRKAKQLTSPAFAFLSCEPLLGPLVGSLHDIDWVIAGGETDQGKHKARPSHPDWIRSLRDQSAAAGAAFHFKQWGEWWEVESDARDEDGDHIVIDDASPLADYFDPKTDCYIAADGRVFRDESEMPLNLKCRWMTRLGKKAAGRHLDGIEHNGFPAEPATAGRPG